MNAMWRAVFRTLDGLKCEEPVMGHVHHPPHRVVRPYQRRFDPLQLAASDQPVPAYTRSYVLVDFHTRPSRTAVYEEEPA